MSTVTDNRKRKQRIAIGLLIVIAIGICAGWLYTDYKGEQDSKNRQLHLFGVQWPEPVSWLRKISAEEFAERFGQPEYIEYERRYSEDVVYSTTLFYDEFCVNYLRFDGEERFANIMVTSGDAELWRGSIKLGSTRGEVEDAFSRVRKDPAELHAYFDSLWAVCFRYTDENIVEQIFLYSEV